MKLSIDSSTDLYKIISAIKKADESDITLEFLSDSLIHKNISNIKVLKKHAQNVGKNINFVSQDEILNEYLQMADEGRDDFKNHPINFDDAMMNDKSNIGSKFKFDFRNIFLGFNSLKFPKFQFRNSSNSLNIKDSKVWIYRLTGIIIFILGIFIIGIWSFLTYVPKALITLKIDSDIFIKLIDVKADAKANTLSTETNVIPASQIEAEESDTKTIDTTGIKKTGEKATGEISITNKKNEKIKIKKGAKMKTKVNDKNLTYFATEDKEIESSKEVTDTNPNEAGDQPGTVYGTGIIKIEADVFGTDHNIDKEKDFEIEGHKDEDVYGKNEKKIEGGSTKDVKVVAQADLDLLKKSVEDGIKEKLKSTLRNRLSSDQVLSEGSIEVSPIKAEYSAKLDEEADNISLTASYSGKAFSFKKSDLDKVIDANINKVIPANFKLSTQKPEYDAIPVSSDVDGVLNIQVKLRSTIIPDLDLEKIKNDLSGMKLDEAQNYLNGLPNVKETSIELTPNLPGPLLRMPKRPANIEIKL